MSRRKVEKELRFKLPPPTEAELKRDAALKSARATIDWALARAANFPRVPSKPLLPAAHKPAGRPSSWDLVSAEATRRLTTNDVPKLLKTFGDQLSTWLSDTHRDATPMQGRTIQNRIRDLWRQRKKHEIPK
jgi:hypothetical protein